MRVLSRYSFYLGLVFLISHLTACSWNKKEEDVGGHVRVQIPFATNGRYSLQVIDLYTVKSLTDFRGEAVQFLMNAEDNGGKIEGQTPQLRYLRNNDGVIIPKDILSLQILTVYAHIERLMALDQKVGAKGILSYPRTAAINASYQTSRGQLENNAIYMGRYDIIALVPYNLQDLPIMANGGVLAHEHFHALFQKLVIQPLGSRYPMLKFATLHEHDPDSQEDGSLASPLIRMVSGKEYHARVLRGLNEGFADVWGWIYTGDGNFIYPSLPQIKLCRDLNIPLNKMISAEGIQSYNTLNSSCGMDVSYFLGNQLARAIRGLTTLMAKRLQASPEQVRFQIGKLIIQTLSGLQKKFVTMADSEILLPGDILLLMAEKLKDVSSVECNYLVDLVSDEDKKVTKLNKTCETTVNPVNP